MLAKELIYARERGAALVAVTTADQPAALTIAAEAAGGDPTVAWDAVRGVYALNAAGANASRAILGGLDPSASCVFSDALAMARDAMLDGGMLVAVNAHRALAGSGADRAVAAVMGLRDAWGKRGATLVLLCSAWDPPAELASDVYVIDDPLPVPDERAAIARETIEGAGLDPSDMVVSTAVRLTAGLSRYAAEQVVALSCDPGAVDEARMLSRFIATVNSTYVRERLTRIADDAKVLIAPRRAFRFRSDDAPRTAA
jgi:hypothetical protein